MNGLLRSGHLARGRFASRGLVAMGLTSAAVGLAACGQAAPLDDALTDAQRQQLNVAWSARINATDPSDVPVAERNTRVTALYKACQPLDKSALLLAAVSGVCQPTAIVAKLGAVLPERCAKPAAVCVRALDRIAESTDHLAVAQTALNGQAAKAIEDPDCRAQFTQDDAQIKAYGDLSAAYRVLALGIEQNDADIAALGQHRIDDAKALLRPAGTVPDRIAKLRDGCGLV